MSDQPTVQMLLAEVMKSIGSVAKREHNPQQHFSFRGIDAVVNAVGPALREHRLVMVPEAAAPIVDHYESRSGAQMTHVLLPVTFRFYGPTGDSVSCTVIGEAADAGDKVMSKAHSVAWRIAMLQCFAIPTDEPDPDSQAHERAPAPPPVTFDWEGLGWTDKAEHDSELAKHREAARALPDDAKARLKAWWDESVDGLPLAAAVMESYGNHIDELAQESEA